MEKVKVTVEYNGKVEVNEGYSVIGGVVRLPKDATLQMVTPFTAGRMSLGDVCSMIGTMIVLAEKRGKDLGIPRDVYLSLIGLAVAEGLERVRKGE